MNTPLRIIEVASRPSPRLLRACAAFGLGVRRTNDPSRSRPRHTSEARIIALSPSKLTLITGPSGSGKSALLADVALAARRTARSVLPLPEPDREVPIIDLIPGRLADAIAMLARAGLGDATLLGKTPAQLSEGERFRFRLALALASRNPEKPTTILIDEFASTLDRTTARCLCVALRRWLDREQAGATRLILGTAHHDVAAWLRPDLTAVIPLGGGPVEFTTSPDAPPAPWTLHARSGSTPILRAAPVPSPRATA